MTAFLRFSLAVAGMVAGFGRAAPADEAPAAPDNWRTYSIRDESAPRFWVEPPRDQGKTPAYGLGMAGRGDDAVDGRWTRTVPIAAARHYTFRAEYQARDVATPTRSILARVLWFNAQGKQVGPTEYPLTSPHGAADGGTVVTGTHQAPAGATQAQLELHLRWTARGEVVWRNVTWRETEPPLPRKVRLAAANHRPRGSKSPQDNLEQFAKLVKEAARQKADVVCLPEGITVVGTGRKYTDVAEPVPGPATNFLGAIARKSRLYVAAGLYERDGKAIYNTSVLLGRDGQLVGKYRKVCLPREEIDGGITPGKEYPVFDTDFGRVGMMICWDVHFPEVARELAARGAEVILLPIWGGNETLARARAIENQLYLVASGYDFPTTVYDKAGQALATTRQDPMVIVAEVDLNERLLWPWLGDWRARIWREGPARKEGAAERQPAGQAAPARPAIGAKDGVTRIPLLPPTPGNPRNSEGAFLLLNDGRLLFVYTHFTGGGSDHAAAHLAARSSRDGGKTWTAEDEVVLPNEARMNVMSVSLLRLADGSIGLFYLRKNALDDCRLYLRKSRDEGKSWGEPTLCIPDAGYFVVNNDRVIQLRSGRLVVPASRRNAPGSPTPHPGMAVCYLSDDNGKTWHRSKTELRPPKDSKTGLQEPAVVELKDGKLLMLCRTDQGCQYRSFSEDGGDTWIPAEPSDLKSPVSPASIKRIPKTTDLLLVWNDHSQVDEARRGKRTPLNAAISRDEGKTWEKVKALEDDPDGWYCYTAIAFVGDRVLLGHCAGDSKVGRLNRTQVTYFDLDWLYR